MKRRPWPNAACIFAGLIFCAADTSDSAPGPGFVGAPNPSMPVASPLNAADQAKTFSLPPGFDIELVASDPDIAKIVTVAFDEAGRVWAVTAVEYPVDEN